jgi:GntR family transcriptional regulator
MDFKSSQPIYLQIADFVCEKILLGTWKPEERIPSVRELAVQLEVNPNTVMRTFEYLQQQEVIYNQRGLGYFVSPSAAKNTLAMRKQEFLDNELPPLLRNMYLLGITLEDVQKKYTQYITENFQS